jgi:hypothetical protein
MNANAIFFIKQNRYYIGYAAGRCLQDFYHGSLFFSIDKIKILWRVASPTGYFAPRRLLLFAMASPCFCVHAVSSIGRLPMINLEAEAQRL